MQPVQRVHREFTDEMILLNRDMKIFLLWAQLRLFICGGGSGILRKIVK
jgi:hypothetical protein